MFAALQLCRSFTLDDQQNQPGLRVRVGINLGPVKLVKDFNGALNAIGDGINAGQRIMSFAPENQILVSLSFFEVVSRLSDDYKQLFQLKGIETDKHVREHTVYFLRPPGLERREPTVANADGQLFAVTPKPTGRDVAGPRAGATTSQKIPWLVAGAALAALAALGVWHFYVSSPRAAPVVNTQAAAPGRMSVSEPEPTAGTAPADPAASRIVGASATPARSSAAIEAAVPKAIAEREATAKAALPGGAVAAVGGRESGL